ncbi:MAG: glycosyltransferase family 2 protein [Alphaproteobacteria bacterium]
MTPADGITLSVIVPCFNEEAVIAETHARLKQVLGGLVPAYEILYVDDGSRDATRERLRELQAGDSHVRVLALSRNFGHQLAVTAGLDHARGEAVVIIDADLQDPPELIADMLRLWREGNDVVYGTRTERDGESRFKLASAKAFYRLLDAISAVPIPRDTGDFRLMDRAVVEAVRAMPERDRFLRGMVAWAGYRQIALPYRRAPRAAGKTKYPLFRMIRLAADGLLSFSTAPLRLAIWLGLATCVLAAVGIIYAVVLRLFTDNWVEGWTLAFVAMLFIGGVQLVVLGIIGEYIGRIYGETKKRPLYLVAERLGFEEEARAPRPVRAVRRAGE